MGNRKNSRLAAVAAPVGTLVTNGATVQRCRRTDMASSRRICSAAQSTELNDFLGGVGGNPFLGLDLYRHWPRRRDSIKDGVASLWSGAPDRLRERVASRRL
jgi:hypothetical protein